MMEYYCAYVEWVRQYLAIHVLLWMWAIALVGKPKVIVRLMSQLGNVEEPMPKVKMVHLLVVCSSTISVFFYVKYCKFIKSHEILATRENSEKASNYYLNVILFAFITLLIISIHSFCEKHLQLRALRKELKKLHPTKHHLKLD